MANLANGQNATSATVSGLANPVVQPVKPVQLGANDTGSWKQGSGGANDWTYNDKSGNGLSNTWKQQGDGKWYFLNNTGKMDTNTTTSDGYYVDDKGVWNGQAQQVMPTPPVQSDIPIYDPSSDIQKMGDAQKVAALAGLQKAHDQSTSDLATAAGKIEPQYLTQRNSVSTDNQIAAKNFAEYMAQRGDNNAGGNNGTNAQSDIASNMSLQGNLGSLAKGEAGAYADNAKQGSDLNVAYNNDIASSNAGIDASTMQSIITAQQAYNAQKIAQANTDRAYNYGVSRDTVTDTGKTANGTETLAGQQQLSTIKNQELQAAYQQLINAGYPAEEAAKMAGINLANSGQTLTNAYQALVNKGYSATQASALAYQAAQIAAVNRTNQGTSGGGGGSSSSKGSAKTSAKKSTAKKTVTRKSTSSGSSGSNNQQAIQSAMNSTSLAQWVNDNKVNMRTLTPRQKAALMPGGSTYHAILKGD